MNSLNCRCTDYRVHRLINTARSVDLRAWNRIFNVEFLHASDAAARYDFFPGFDRWFEEWIDATGLWSGNLTESHDRPLTLVATSSALGKLREEWDDAARELRRSLADRHPSLAAAERNR